MHPRNPGPAHPLPLRGSNVVEHAIHDGRPSGHVLRVTEPTRPFIEDCFFRPAVVGGQDGNASKHGFEGHDAEVFVGGRVDEEAGGAEEGVFEGRGDGEEEEDGDGGGGGEGGDEGFGG